MRLRPTAHPLCAFVALFILGALSVARAQDNASAFCVIAADRDISPVYHTGAWPGSAVLVSAEKGLFVARARDGKVALTRATGTDTGPVLATHAISQGALIGALSGLFVGRDASGGANVTAVKADTDRVFTFQDLPGAGVLVGAQNGTFLAKGAASGVSIAKLETDTGRVFEMMRFSENTVLIGAERGWFIARNANGKATLTPAGSADTGYARSVKSLPGIGLLIEAQAGWFLASEQGGAVTVAPFGDSATGIVGTVADLASGRMLMHTQNGWFVADGRGGSLAFARVDGPDAERVFRLVAFRDSVIGYSRQSWFVAREKDGKITFATAGSYETTSDAFHYHELTSGAVLIGSLSGLFVVRPSEEKPSITKLDGHDTGYIFMMREVAGRRALIGARKEFFIAHEQNGKIELTPAGNASETGRLIDVPRYPGYLSHDLPDGTILLGAQKALLAAVPRACPGR